MKTVGIYLFDEVEVLDFAGPFEVFSVASQLRNYESHRVLTFSDEGQTIHAVNGLSVNPDQSLEQIETLDFLVIPGGQGSNEVIKKPAVLQKLDQLIQSAEWTMSVCSGSRVLGVLGHLDHKAYCSHHSVYSNMTEIVPSGDPRPDLRFVPADEKIYTAAGISAGIDLSFFLLEQTWGIELAIETAEYMEYLPYLSKE
ncbi:DJ-1/PfpI family protein [Algoriphagus namhaensis]|uniref:DJ-1/PfpI family protein n=1 Tax=Algoriphagus namhaensis TaxID=915353 RepID=A0ABV8AU45_9BACT